ncbi:MAG TPA: 2,5-diamino-6-(ribosylamino)-4(3H)-pyrimidinone 5'-phosphate reductase [Nitrososphaeraceae archaeon]|nr:2,5-diamino-6-(ribosylamino)-4(3H)-pyrimidinone 5'-phosphate reductase [Nitrososphaeraceae archaeon]
MYVILNAAMSIDGKISTRRNDSSFSSTKDWKRVHKLRSSVDGIVVGISTVLEDNPMLNVRYFSRGTRLPTRIIIDSKARIPLNSRIVRSSKNIQTIIGTTHNAPTRKIKELKKAGVQVIFSGKGKVNIKNLFEQLENLGIKRILVEGGGEINWSVLKIGLANELIVAISPVVVGGRDAKTLVEGEGIANVINGMKMRLSKTLINNKNEIVLFYKLR